MLTCCTAEAPSARSITFTRCTHLHVRAVATGCLLLHDKTLLRIHDKEHYCPLKATESRFPHDEQRSRVCLCVFVRVFVRDHCEPRTSLLRLLGSAGAVCLWFVQPFSGRHSDRPVLCGIVHVHAHTCTHTHTQMNHEYASGLLWAKRQ